MRISALVCVLLAGSLAAAVGQETKPTGGQSTMPTGPGPLAAGLAAGPDAAAGGIDNSALIPKVLGDSEVKMEGMSPDWVKTLIMAQFRIETATPEGTFASATKVLDHYARMGVNGLWINPVYERGTKDRGYGSFGPRTIEPLLSGTASTEDSFKVVKQFVDEAHKRNIRVIFDIIVWGTAKTAPLLAEHPEFYKKKDGQFVPAWGGWAFDWNNPALRKWFTESAVAFIQKTGADGFRVDLAPDTSGYFFEEVRDALYAQGRKIILVSELPNARREVFDFEQNGAHGWTEEPKWGDKEKLKQQKARFGRCNEFLLRSNIVDDIRTGTGIGKATLQAQGRGGMFRFYTSNLLCHDDQVPFVQGNRVRFGYGAVFAPFIPMWWIGEEWNNPRKFPAGPGQTGVMYFNIIDWSKLANAENRAFFEDVKKFIRIRRSYPEIFQNFPDSTRNANIAKLATTRDGKANTLQAYARYASGKAVLVVPNYNGAGASATRSGSVNTSSNASTSFEITPDYDALGLAGAKRYRITDLLTDTRITDDAQSGKSFTVDIPAEHLGVYLVEGEELR